MSQEQKPLTEQQRHERRARQARVRRVQKWIGRGAAGTAAVTVAIAGYGELKKYQHVEGAGSIPALKAQLGHVPESIKSIEPTGDPNVVSVDVVVPQDQEKQFVSAIAADLHALAPNQDPQTEFDIINTYAKQPNSVQPGDEFHILVNPHSGDILENPQNSAHETS